MKVSIKFFLCLLPFILFLLFTFWWYGLFSDIGKKDESFAVFSWAGFESDNFDIYDLDPMVEWRKAISEITTKNVVEIFAQNSPVVMSQGIYNMPASFSKLYDKERMNDPFPIYVSELLKRNNSAAVLLHYYEELSTNGIYANQEAFGCFELILAQPQFQRHLTPEDRARIPEIVKRKQREKFATPEYSPHRYCNFLYTDAYTVDEKGDIHWDEEKLMEYAKPFEYLAEIEDIEILKIEVEKMETQWQKEKWQKALNHKTHPHWARFDNCQVTQP